MDAREQTRTRKGGTRVTKALDGAEIIGACRRIVDESQYAKVNGFMVDLFSASAIVKVDTALNEANRAKFRALDVGRMARLAFKMLG